jgi:hypothetical protein
LSGGGQDYLPFADPSVGLINDIRPAREILSDTVEAAERIIGTALPRPGQQF